MESYLSFSSLALVLSILVNIYAFHRLVLLPYFAEVFYSNGSDLEELIVSRRDKRLEYLLDEVIKKAEEKGFKIKRPRVRILKRGLGLLVVSEIPARACASGYFNRILFDGKWFRVNSNDVRRSIMAHELGHIVDHQTNRIGHPLFEKIRHVDQELFADAFAAFLYSKQDVIEIREPWYLAAHFNKEKFMKLDLNIEPECIGMRSD